MNRGLTQSVVCRRNAESLAMASELEQIAWSEPGEVAKRCKCSAGSIATAAFDHRRFRRPVGVINPNS
jgi:hypothetical protein